MKAVINKSYFVFYRFFKVNFKSLTINYFLTFIVDFRKKIKNKKFSNKTKYWLNLTKS